MPHQSGSSLPWRQKAVFAVEGDGMHAYGRDHIVFQRFDQGNAIVRASKRRPHAPSLGRGAELIAVRHQVPPVHAGLGTDSRLMQKGRPFGCGQIHRHQSWLGEQTLEFEQLPQRQGLAGDGIHRPSGSQGLDPFAHHAAALDLGIPWGHQHRCSPHLIEQQAALQQAWRRHGIAVAEADGPLLQQIAMAAQLVAGTIQGQRTPEVDAHVVVGVAAEAMQAFDPVSPGVGTGQ